MAIAHIHYVGLSRVTNIEGIYEDKIAVSWP